MKFIANSLANNIIYKPDGCLHYSIRACKPKAVIEYNVIEITNLRATSQAIGGRTPNL
jgi:hypothetical protein